MALTRLALTDFRSHADLLIEGGPGLMILAGPNGAGKTNVLEAISLLAPGRGLRGAALADMARSDGPGGFAVAARLATDVGEVAIGTGTQSAAPERRQVRINGAAAAANGLGEWLSILWLTPQMDRLFVEGASGRRRFLDRLVLALEPGHATHATRYEAAMRARNRLLAEGEGRGAPDPAWLAALEEEMAAHGLSIADARARTVAALAARLAAGGEDGGFPRPAIALEGWAAAGDAADERGAVPSIAGAPGAGDPPDRAAALRVALADARVRDRAAARALIGPHRTDLAVTHVVKGQPAARASTGEQKALLLALILAHADLVAEKVGRRPILLLDEVAAHLDPDRRAALFARLAAAGGQVWLTGTETGLFAGAPGATVLRL